MGCAIKHVPKHAMSVQHRPALYSVTASSLGYRGRPIPRIAPPLGRYHFPSSQQQRSQGLPEAQHYR